MSGINPLKQLIVFCEGQTEQRFCSVVLQSHLFPQGDGMILTLATGKKGHHHIHGIRKYSPLKKFISHEMKSKSSAELRFTTMIDLYGLPPDFPGKLNAIRNPNNPTPYVLALESAFASDIGDVRFIPHLQLHEFETMLLADPDQFAIAFENCVQQVASLKDMISQFQSIEHINDGQQTAPSKRICQIFPTYVGRKSTAGVDIANNIGLLKIRSHCPHVDQWIRQLENHYWGDV